jgi:hypothetical protein
MNIPFFRISGIFVFIFSLISVIFVKNLFLRFFGTAFLIVFAYLAVYYIVIHFYYKKKKIEAISLSGKDLLPFKSSKIEVTGKYFPAYFPGIFFSIKFEVQENGTICKKACETTEDIDGGRIFFETEFDRHGKYLLKNFKFVFRDIFGFTNYEIPFGFEQEIDVRPYFTEEIEIPYFTDVGGEQAIQNASKVSSTDFFENRKYYPGDDIRRINWKIFAHINELHVREVEKIPPKVGEISLLFAPYSENLTEYEYISSLFFSTSYFLLKNNFELKILAPFSNMPVIINGENENEFNGIVFNSYKPFVPDRNTALQNPIIFASFGEYSSLMESGYIKKNSYCKISFSENDETKKSLLKAVYKIDNFDNLVRELAGKIRNLRNRREYESRLKGCVDKGLADEINTEVFRISYEQFKNFK